MIVTVGRFRKCCKGTSSAFFSGRVCKECKSGRGHKSDRTMRKEGFLDFLIGDSRASFDNGVASDKSTAGMDSVFKEGEVVAL